MTVSNKSIKSVACTAFVMLLALPWASTPAFAEVSVPAKLQVSLFAKVANYERTFSDRVGTDVHILIVTASGVESRRVGSQLEAALAGVPTVGGQPVRVSVERWSSAAELNRRIATDGVDVVYLSTGLDVGAATASLAGVAVLTIAADPSDVVAGAILGFDLENAKPKIVVNVKQAKAQQLQFAGKLLGLARLVR